MAKNSNLSQAKKAKNDEFYTQYNDIQKEINNYIEFNPDVFRNKTILLPCDDPEWSNFTKFFAQNFERYGIKKLISTSFAVESKKVKEGYAPTLFETESPTFDKDKTRIKGKIFTLERTENGTSVVTNSTAQQLALQTNSPAPLAGRGQGAGKRLDINALQWEYLEGDGDFKSKEVTALRDEADIIITNPPFSLFREFVKWVIDGNKQFLIIGSMNAISYKEIFPLIRDNQIWLGVSNGSQTYITIDGGKQTMGNTCWYTNLDHGARHQPLRLMTMEDNRIYNKQLLQKNPGAYIQYANYDAIEIPNTKLIPADYNGTMGVPLSFLYRYCPEQFEIIGQTQGDSGKELGLIPFNRELKKLNASLRDGQLYYMLDGMPQKPYARILIRKIQ